MKKLHVWQHASLAALLLLVFLLLAWLLLIQPAVSQRRAFQDRVDDLQFQFGKLQNAEGEARRLAQELAGLKAARTDSAGFLDEKSAALAAADLQARAATVIEASRGRLMSTQVVQEKAEVFPKVTIKIHMRGDINALKNTLFQIENNLPVLFVDNLLVMQRGGNSRTQRTSADEALDIRFDLSGYMFVNAIE